MKRFTQWLPLVILIPLWGGGLILDRVAERALIEDVHERLVVALHAHQQHLLAMLAHQQRGLRLFAAGAVGSLAKGNAPRLDGAYLSKHLPEAIGCSLFDAQGRLIAQTDVPGPPASEMAAEIPAEFTVAVVTDPSTEPSGASVYDAYVPLRNAASDARTQGQGDAVLACRLKNTLSEMLISHRAGLGLTGEVYLVSAKTRFMLTESRFLPNAVGHVKVDTVGVREALKMRNGIAPYPDYRGIPVIGTFLYLREYDWVLLAEMDEAEALAPLLRLRITLGLILGLISIAAGFVGWRYGRQMVGAFAQLEEAETQMRALMHMAADAVFEIDETGTIMIANKAAHRMFGWPAGELIGQNITVIIPPEDRERHLAGLRRYLTTGERRLIGKVTELTGCRRDGTPVSCELSLAAIILPDGSNRFIGIHRDITERKRMETRLRTFECAIESAEEGIVITGPEGIIAYTNPALDRMFGYERGGPNGRPVSCIFPPEWQEQRLPSIVAAAREKGWTGEVTGLRKDGTTFPRWVAISPVRDAEGRLIGMMSVSHDYTERKRTEEQLRLQAAALEAAANGIMIADRNGTILWVNPAMTKLTGYSAAEMIGQNPRLLKSGEQDLSFYQNLWETISSGQAWHGGLINRRKDGSLYTEEQTITPVRDVNGEITNFIAIKQDVTERKQAENALRESRQKYLSLIDSIDGIVCEVDAQTYQFAFVSKRAEQLMGYPVAQWLAEPTFWQDHIHPEDRDRAMAFCSQATAEKRDHQFEYRMLAADGRTVWFRDLVTVVVEHDRPVKLQGVMLDITDRKRSEEELKQRLEELERFQKATVQREFRIKELKEELERLKRRE